MSRPAKTAGLLAVAGAEIMRLVDPVTLIDELAEGFKALTLGHVQAPPRPKVDVPGKGFSLAMLSWTSGRHIALKAVNVYEGNHALGLASHQALVSLFDADTGAPIALMDGASLTRLRTTASAMLSVRALARQDARTALVVGAGVQAAEHVRQLNLVRDFADILVFARNPDRARAMAASVPNGRFAANLEAAAAVADVICLTTSSASPVISDAWIRPGTHVTSVGYAPPGSELPPALVGRATLFVEARSAFQPAPVGCVELAGREPQAGTELGQVLLGQRPGRSSPSEVTLYKSMGNAMEDMVVANLAYEAALAGGAGQRVAM